jgi:hypothetical protein
MNIPLGAADCSTKLTVRSCACTPGRSWGKARVKYTPTRGTAAPDWHGEIKPYAWGARARRHKERREFRLVCLSDRQNISLTVCLSRSVCLCEI